MDYKTKKETVRIAGKLKEIITIQDLQGNLIHKMMSPLMVELYPRDVIQVIVGASLLAIPMAFTEETWRLGETLPMQNIWGIVIVSLFFISSFVYYNFYRNADFGSHWMQFIKRIITTYCISILVVALILTLIDKTMWGIDLVVTIKRILLVTFPASMSAAVADMIK